MPVQYLAAEFRSAILTPIRMSDIGVILDIPAGRQPLAWCVEDNLRANELIRSGQPMRDFPDDADFFPDAS